MRQNRNGNMQQPSPFTIHAKERACERYGIVFTKKQWSEFGRTLDNPKYAVRLSAERLACYFLKNWYLLIREENGTVMTFLARENITEEDKLVLSNDERYRQINDDAFHVWSNMQSMVAMPSRKKSVELPDKEKLSSDASQSAECLLNKICNKRNYET